MSSKKPRSLNWNRIAFHIKMFFDFVLRFGNDSMERVVDWMSKNSLVSKDMSILDIGCGNGMMLVKLVWLYIF